MSHFRHVIKSSGTPCFTLCETSKHIAFLFSCLAQIDPYWFPSALLSNTVDFLQAWWKREVGKKRFPLIFKYPIPIPMQHGVSLIQIHCKQQSWLQNAVCRLQEAAYQISNEILAQGFHPDPRTGCATSIPARPRLAPIEASNTGLRFLMEAEGTVSRKGDS